MVKRHYIQDYSENFRGNTETRTVASDFIRPSIESSQPGEEKNAQIRHLDMWWGQVALMENRVKKNRKKGRKKNQWRIAVVCTINKICAGEKTSRDTSEEPQEPQRVS